MRLHTFCRQLNIPSWAPDYHSLVFLWYREHRMVAAKFGVFGNNIETTGIQEKRALCHLPEDPPGGPASHCREPCFLPQSPGNQSALWKVLGSL